MVRRCWRLCRRPAGSSSAGRGTCIPAPGSKCKSKKPPRKPSPRVQTPLLHTAESQQPSQGLGSHGQSLLCPPCPANSTENQKVLPTSPQAGLGGRGDGGTGDRLPWGPPRMRPVIGFQPMCWHSPPGMLAP